MSTSQVAWNGKDIATSDDAEGDAYLLRESICSVTEVIPSVWPLRDYVAVNPYAGISHRTFMEARDFLRVFSDSELLMPMDHYANEYHHGHFTQDDIEAAMEELASVGISQSLTAAQLVQNLESIGCLKGDLFPDVSERNPDRPVRTIAEHAAETSELNWTEVIVEEISKHCAAHYDRGQAVWGSPYAGLTLYEAWRTVAAHDLHVELLGLSGFRRFVSRLPDAPEDAILHLLRMLDVPQRLWETFLLCQAFSVPGWSAWTKSQVHRTDTREEGSDLVCLLAIRLAYDAALSKSESLSVNWKSYFRSESASFRASRAAQGGDAFVRYILLRATEIAYRNSLLQSLSLKDRHTKRSNDRKLAQMVFCIDVRSERIRRHIEKLDGEVDTFGFAGFFGMAFEFEKLGQQGGSLQLPVLLKPQFKVCEGLHGCDSETEAAAIARRQQARSWQTLWKNFQASAASCFSFVESTGVFYGWRLLGRAMRWETRSSRVGYTGLSKKEASNLGPTLGGLAGHGLSESRQVDLAESMLRNLGLTKDFARWVVLCGHASQTENNPLAASLDCGACGGHSGEPNGRFAALLLNQPNIRKALAERGIDIPPDTSFLGALHNTTTDCIQFYENDSLTDDPKASLQVLKDLCSIASDQTRSERLTTVDAKSIKSLLKRAQDWSEVRPEWGLAGNAAFIVAPRSMTQKMDLHGRTFLHSYDPHQDGDGKVLETIMTAPMIVAHWINMQYYASTVDNPYFGSGNKTIHNIVGGFGLLSGNGGDLMTGLPWQSLHTGKHFQHLPMRMQVVIDASREKIDHVIKKHELVSNLLMGGWLHLIAIEQQSMYQFTQDGEWKLLGMDTEAEDKSGLPHPLRKQVLQPSEIS